MMAKRERPASLKPGYFLGQEASSCPTNVLFRRLNPYLKPFLTVEGARRYFDQIAGRVDGLDFVPYWYEPADAEMCRAIAQAGRDAGIDMWAGVRWHKQFRDLPIVPADCAGWTMDASGRIAPAVWEQRNQSFDYLNPKAVDWLLDALEERFWSHVKGVVNGFFFPEVRIVCSVPYGREAFQPWTLHAYSPYVLDEWRRWCAEHDVRWEGSVVDRFPVPRPGMVAAEPDKTMHVPNNVPAAAPAFTRFADIPHGTAVWLAWEDFLCEMLHANFIHRVAERVNRYHADEPDWRGVCFFNNDCTMLDYRNYRTDTARTGHALGHYPQGRRMGVDIRRLLDDPEITCFISETIEPVNDYYWYEENALSHGMELARRHGRERDYGFMVHYCDLWGQTGDVLTPGAGIMDDLQEDLRWEMIHQYRPPVFSFYSIPAVLVKEGAWYRQEAAERFWSRVQEYKRTFAQ